MRNRSLTAITSHEVYKYFGAVRHVQVDMYIEMHSEQEKSNLPSRQRVTRVDEEGRTAAGT